LKSGYPVGSAVDIFALGIILYSMMYFKLPFKDDKLAHLNAIVTYPQTPKYSVKLQSLLK